MEQKSQAQPLVTIGILSYNRGHKIGATIESILNQGYKNLEILISDDASDDNNETIDTCGRYIDRDKRITLFVQKINIGPYHNYEFLVNQAHGKYFMWMSDDDEMKPNIIGRYVDFLENNPDYSLVSGKILHWKNGELVYVEKNLSLEDNFKLLRVANFYAKVRSGAVFYGLMRTHELRNVSFIKNRLASDWHLVAHMAYLGKVKQLNFVSMNKNSGGFSSDWKNYAKIVGAGKMAGMLPFVMIGFDTLKDIWHNSNIYGQENKVVRVITGLVLCLVIWTRRYAITYPRIIGGKIKRSLSLQSGTHSIKMLKRIIPVDK